MSEEDNTIKDLKERLANAEHLIKGYEAGKDDKINVLPVIRTVQAFCLGLFVLGISMMAGDVSGAVHLPVSALSLTTTLFGGIGSLVSEFMARKAEKW